MLDFGSLPGDQLFQPAVFGHREVPPPVLFVSLHSVLGEQTSQLISQLAGKLQQAALRGENWFASFIRLVSGG
jgi:hypothetical protein